MWSGASRVSRLGGTAHLAGDPIEPNGGFWRMQDDSTHWTSWGDPGKHMILHPREQKALDVIGIELGQGRACERRAGGEMRAEPAAYAMNWISPIGAAMLAPDATGRR